MAPNYEEGLPSMSDNIWLSDPGFDLGKISGLFDVANKSLSSIFGVYDEFKLNEEDPLNFEDFDADLFVSDSVGPIVYISIWAAIAVLFTIGGIIWCLCNKCICCCKSSFTSGGKNIDDLETSDPRYQLRPYYSERNDGKKRSKTGGIIISVLMAIWLLAFLLIIIHTFATNEKINESIDNISGDLDNTKSDIDSYLETTRNQFKFTFKTSYDKLTPIILGIWDACTECNVGAPPRGLANTGNLENDIDQLVAVLNTASKAYSTESLVSFKSTLNQLYQDAPRDKLEEALENTRSELNMNVDTLDTSIVEVQEDIGYAREDIRDSFEFHLKDANSGLYWGIMLFNVLYCLIFILVLVGTVLATFARQNGLKMGGYLLYRVAIVLMLVISVLVVIQMLVAFVAAGIAAEVFCPAIRELENPKVTTKSPPIMIKGVVEGKQSSDEGYQTPSFGEILRKCKANESAYNVFDLQQSYNVNDIRDISENFKQLLQNLKLLTREFDSKTTTFSYDLNLELNSIESAFNSSENISTLVSNTRDKINKFRSTGPVSKTGVLDQNPIEDAINEIVKEVDLYEDFVIKVVTEMVGNCGPAYQAINATIAIFEFKVTAPITSYWFILQFIPLTFLLIFITALVFERIHF